MARKLFFNSDKMTEMAPSNRQTKNVSVSCRNLQPPAPESPPLLKMMATARYRLPPIPTTVPAEAAAWSKIPPPCPPATTSVRHQGDLARGLEGRKLKPRCSYGCVIGLALRTSLTNSLPVNEMYSAIQSIFPYFKVSPPNGWKNSVRHCLSLGKYFRKVESVAGGGCQMKKGFQWEVVPEKRLALDKEIESFLRKEMVSQQSTVHLPPAPVPGGPVHGQSQLASQQRNSYGNVRHVYAQITPEAEPPANHALNLQNFLLQSNNETKFHPQQQLQLDVKLPHLSISPAAAIVDTRSDVILDRQPQPQITEPVNPGCEMLGGISTRPSLDCEMVELTAPVMVPLTSGSYLPGEIIEATTLSTMGTHSVHNDPTPPPLPCDHNDVQGDAYAVDDCLLDFDQETLDNILSLLDSCDFPEEPLLPDMESKVTEYVPKGKSTSPGKRPRLDDDNCDPSLAPTPSKVIKVDSTFADSPCNAIGFTASALPSVTAECEISSVNTQASSGEGDDFSFLSLLHSDVIQDWQLEPQLVNPGCEMLGGISTRPSRDCEVVELTAPVMGPLTFSSHSPGEIFKATTLSTVGTHSVHNDPTPPPIPSDHDDVQGDAVDDCLLDFDKETLDNILSLLDSCDFPEELLDPEMGSITSDKEPKEECPYPGKSSRLDEGNCDLSLNPTLSCSKVVKVDSSNTDTFCNTICFTPSVLPSIAAEFDVSTQACTGEDDDFSSIDNLIEKTCLNAAILRDQLPDESNTSRKRTQQCSVDSDFCYEFHSPTPSKVRKLDSYFHDLLFNTVVYSEPTPLASEYPQEYSGSQTEGSNIDTILSMIECTGLDPTTGELSDYINCDQPSVPIFEKPDSMVSDSLVSKTRGTDSTLLESGNINTSSSCQSPLERSAQRDGCGGTSVEESTPEDDRLRAEEPSQILPSRYLRKKKRRHCRARKHSNKNNTHPRADCSAEPNLSPPQNSPSPSSKTDLNMATEESLLVYDMLDDESVSLLEVEVKSEEFDDIIDESDYIFQSSYKELQEEAQ